MSKTKEKINFTFRGFEYRNIPLASYSSDTNKELGVIGTAYMIKQYLTKTYPDYKFWVNSEVYAGGSSIRVNAWSIPEKDAESVRDFVRSFQHGSFDSSTDMYEYSRPEPILHDGKTIGYGAKFVFFENKPPYGSAEYEKPVPDYGSLKPSDEDNEPKSTPSVTKQKDEPVLPAPSQEPDLRSQIMSVLKEVLESTNASAVDADRITHIMGKYLDEVKIGINQLDNSVVEFIRHIVSDTIKSKFS
jgi:hypothetical protein